MNKYLKVPTHNPNVCIRILQLNTANPFRRSVMAGPSLLQPPPCRGGVISVHHDPVHGICTNPGNREWEPFPLSFFVVCAYPVHRVMVNWDPPISQYLGLPGGIQKGNTSGLPHSRGPSLYLTPKPWSPRTKVLGADRGATHRQGHTLTVFSFVD